MTEKFACGVCLDAPTKPVTTRCGHIYCWRCIKEWFATSHKRECPTCRAAVSKADIIKIYSTDNESDLSEEDDRPTQATTPLPEAPQMPNNLFRNTSFNIQFGFGPIGPALFLNNLLPSRIDNQARTPEETRRRIVLSVLKHITLTSIIILIILLFSDK
eukprot:GAHX01000758.1.p1 GENE.GAHX01000758.1~~GAHX01000758.1.p1  ORF type:complete len:173 (-),score=18.30 GAHX01000758.1:82-558(-)